MDEIEQQPDQGEKDLKDTIHEQNKKEEHKGNAHSNPGGEHTPDHNPVHHGSGGR